MHTPIERVHNVVDHVSTDLIPRPPHRFFFVHIPEATKLGEAWERDSNVNLIPTKKVLLIKK